MLEVLTTLVAPIFALSLIGALLAAVGLLTRERTAGLVAFIIYAALPALLFRSLSRGFSGIADWNLIVSYAVSTLAVYAGAAYVARRHLRRNPNESYLFAMGSSFSNSVMMGVPVVHAVFGEAGVVSLTFIILFNTVILLGGTTLLIEFSSSGRDARSRAVLSTIQGLLFNPIILGIAIGLLWGAFQWPIPGFLAKVVKSLSAAVLPCGMVAIGASVVGMSTSGNFSDSALLTAIKLVVHPVFAWLIARYLFALDLEGQFLVALVAALPLAGNVFVLAQKYQTYVDRSATAFVMSTAISLLSLSFLITVISTAVG
jgi:malonate transporter